MTREKTQTLKCRKTQLRTLYIAELEGLPRPELCGLALFQLPRLFLFSLFYVYYKFVF